MVEIKVYNDIANEKDAIFLSMFGIDNAVMSADLVKRIFEENSNETDFLFSIHCDGGSVSEGLAIYDIIRNSGKTIHCNIEGSCHSMAIVLLLAAPKENRTANRNARALIHKVRTYIPDYATADELQAYAEDVKREESAILDIYAERTGTDRETLENVMKEEKVRTAQEMLDLGFISEINSYNTNQYKKTMSKNLRKQVAELLNKASRMLDVVNYDFTDADGNLLFSTEKEDDTIEVGDKATPDGVFTLEDGRTVTIEEGVITKIEEAEQPAEGGESEEMEQLRKENEALKQQIADMSNCLREIRNQITSDAKIDKRVTEPKGGENAKSYSKEEIKNRLKK